MMMMMMMTMMMKIKMMNVTVTMTMMTMTMMMMMMTMMKIKMMTMTMTMMTMMMMMMMTLMMMMMMMMTMDCVLRNRKCGADLMRAPVLSLWWTAEVCWNIPAPFVAMTSMPLCWHLVRCLGLFLWTCRPAEQIRSIPSATSWMEPLNPLKKRTVKTSQQIVITPWMHARETCETLSLDSIMLTCVSWILCSL